MRPRCRYALFAHGRHVALRIDSGMRSGAESLDAYLTTKFVTQM